MTKRWSDETEKQLIACGWSPGRSDPTDYAGIVKQHGWLISQPALDFLREFGGLKVSTMKSWSWAKSLLDHIGLCYAIHSIDFGSEDLFDLDEENPHEMWTGVERLMGPVCPLGTWDWEVIWVWMDRDGAVFHGDIDSRPPFSCRRIFRIGNTGDEAIENICRGIRSKRWRRPPDRLKGEQVTS